MAYSTPGTERRFIPKKGFLYTPFSRRPAKTVLGTEFLYQPAVSNSRRETFSPPPATLADDCTSQPSRKTSSLARAGAEDTTSAAMNIMFVRARPILIFSLAGIIFTSVKNGAKKINDQP